MNATAPAANLELINKFAALAREPHTLPTPARDAELDATLRPLRRQAQARFNTDGLPRGLRLAA